MIESLLELLLQIVAQVIGEVVFEFFISLGWEWLFEAGKPIGPENQVWTYGACFFVGAFAGAVSILIIGHRLTPHSFLPGVSLIAAPIATGLIMSRVGDAWVQRQRRRPVLFSFGAGAIFAFGMALVRFVYIEVQWRPF
jgi:hypothetical protein